MQIIVFEDHQIIQNFLYSQISQNIMTLKGEVDIFYYPLTRPDIIVWVD